MTRWRDQRIQPRAHGILASPYYEWIGATGSAYYGGSSWLPVLLELRDTTVEQFARTVFEMQKRKKGEQDWAAEVRVPPFYGARPERLRKPTHFLALLATRNFLQAVYEGRGPSEIKRFEVGRAVALSSGEAPQPKKAKRKGAPPAVVTGVIDDGIAFAHERFLSADGTTRIEYFWDQVEPSAVWGTWGYGREVDKRDPVGGIDKRMQDSRHGAQVDEDELYRVAGFFDQSKPGHKSIARRAAHGTHVMDLACGGGPRPAPGARPIVAVQLPTETTADTSGATLGPQVFNGLAYIIDRAESIAIDAGTGPLPVVVNVSYGLIAGPHDGSSLLEEAIDELLESCDDRAPVRVVLPAGNNYLSRCHACFSIPGGGRQELRWRVQPDDWTESHLEIWLPKGADVMVTVIAPDGDATNPFSFSAAQQLIIDGQVVGEASYYPPGAAGRRALVRLSLAPTGWPAGDKVLAPAGLWRIVLVNGDKAAVPEVQAWIQRDDTPLGYRRRGRQSHFDDPAYARFDDGGRAIEDDNDPRTAASYVKRNGSLNAIATGKHPIVVGAQRRSDWKPASYSGAGPVVRPPGRGNPNPDGPEAMTVSDDSPSHFGIRAAGSRSGSSVAMQGTSVAAPQIARWVAEELAQGRAGDRKAVAKYTKKVVAPPLYTEKNPPAGAVPKPARERGGDGRIEFPAGGRARAERL